MLFTPLAASRGVRIETDDPLLQFMLAFADRSMIPAQLPFCQVLTSFSSCTYCPCQKQAAGTAFERFFRLSQYLFHFLDQFHFLASQSFLAPVYHLQTIPSLEQFRFRESLTK